jgi:hypothetical protein
MLPLARLLPFGLLLLLLRFRRGPLFFGLLLD